MREIKVSSSEIVSMVGGVLTVVSTLLPWYHTIMTSPLPSPPFVKSVLGIETIDGKIVFALGIASLGVLFIPRYKIRSVLAVTFGLIISLVGWYDLYSRTRNTGVHLRVVVDIGFFLAVIASIILLIGGLIDLWKHGYTLRTRLCSYRRCAELGHRRDESVGCIHACASRAKRCERSLIMAD